MTGFNRQINPLRAWSGVCLTVLLLSSGCATDATRPKPAIDDIQTSVGEGIDIPGGAESEAIPESISSALLPPVQISVPEAKPQGLEQRFDVKVRRAPARDFFMSLVEGTPYNMVVHPDVGGRITLDLKNVSVPEVMATVRNVYGYDFRSTGGGFQVLPKALRTELFTVDYLNIKRLARSRTEANPSQLTASDSRRGGRAERSGSVTDGGSDRGTRTALGSSIDTESEADFWSGLKSSLREIIGGEQGRNVTVNPQAGVVTVRAMPDELRDVQEYIQAIQKVSRRQVIIEARVLEVELNDSSQSGINWAELRQANGNIGAMSIGSGGNSNFSGTTEGRMDNLSGGSVRGRTITTNSEFGGPFTFAVGSGSFTAFIDLLRTQGNVQVLSRPRVSSMNNQKAVIKVGSDEFFVTDISTTAATTVTGTTTGPNVSLTPFFSGVTLDVIPQIAESGDIILHVHPAVSEVTEQVKNIGLSSTSNLNVPLAASSIRESDTVVRASSGQVIVLGGLMQNGTKDEEQAIPVLGSIPVLGGLFRHTVKSSRKSELVILLKPTVVEGGDTWSRELERSAETFEELRQ